MAGDGPSNLQIHHLRQSSSHLRRLFDCIFFASLLLVAFFASGCPVLLHHPSRYTVPLHLPLLRDSREPHPPPPSQSLPSFVRGQPYLLPFFWHFPTGPFLCLSIFFGYSPPLLICCGCWYVSPLTNALSSFFFFSFSFFSLSLFGSLFLTIPRVFILQQYARQAWTAGYAFQKSIPAVTGES